MALFLVLFNRCRVPLFPVRESPFSKWARAPSDPYVRLVVQCLFTLCIFIFSKAQTHSSGSALVLFQVQTLFNKDLFLPHFSFC